MSGLRLEDVIDPTKGSKIPENTPHLYSNRFLTPSGKARFFPIKYKQGIIGNRGFILITDRGILMYNTDNEIRKVSGKFEWRYS
ncbi:hypothetical protein [Vulcanisaeta thermophila]|uniref:hypothetical protein n=1 Tax=Vulcanisaeta thermophila TaxID=867917 RepID=UPI00085364D4|nr:hypothetical protein [Vulcanisaeta thermophila]